MMLADALWRENAGLAEAALAHPFVRGIADGTLPQDRFAGYVAQDAFFLESFARGYALAIAHSPDRAALDSFTDLLDGVRAELRLHASYAERWGIDLTAVTASPATTAYTDFLLATAALGGVGLTCAAMTPCMRLYAHLGQRLADGPVDGRYAEWVDTYADPGFETLAATLEELLDRHADPDSPRVRAAYRRAMELELAFFTAAFEAR
ncbi:aminopyrimidine aminohydrolase [Virgisporangium aliadipatigenens]|uniref:Aminopyrimidine aminohydrolase n=1 Tax=Virgisporangium aliadipatigenens TaxID=741659 RepID=A0A8J4DNL8_9ACTN|nr:TenA family protein [Virgisporangium aliadipatigenens]GIJ43708.1 aminopyrimidine aminohydrolase [Virgisporangium aliadipatigenens]